MLTALSLFDHLLVLWFLLRLGLALYWKELFALAALVAVLTTILERRLRR